MTSSDDFGNKKILYVGGYRKEREHVTALLDKMGYDCIEIDTGLGALFNLRKDPSYDLLLIEAELPDITGIDLLSRIRTANEERISAMPTILLTAPPSPTTVAAAMKWRVNDFLVKPFGDGAFVHRISMWGNMVAQERWSTLSTAQQRVLNVTFETLDAAWKSMEKEEPIDYPAFSKIGLMIADIAHDEGATVGILEALRQHDGYTFVHSLRTATYLTLFAKALSFPEEKVILCATGGVMHDLGKARTPLDVLNKPGKFDPEEWRIMQQHVDHTVAILKETPGVEEEVIEIAWSHHEKMDGSGYPRGLSGDAFSKLARMSSIADAYVALTDRRVYKPAMPAEKAFDILRDASHFDQNLVTQFKEQVFNWLQPKSE